MSEQRRNMPAELIVSPFWPRLGKIAQARGDFLVNLPPKTDSDAGDRS
jgi:hypothetical protein